jgi:hypothetical protein
LTAAKVERCEGEENNSVIEIYVRSKKDYELLTELHVWSSTINVEFNMTEVSILLSDNFLLSYEGKRKPNKKKIWG